VITTMQASPPEQEVDDTPKVDEKWNDETENLKLVSSDDITFFVPSACIITARYVLHALLEEIF
jgi:hypothetical protein